MSPSDDELFAFAEPESGPDVQSHDSLHSHGRAHWPVLVVDDEPDVHAVTLLALRGVVAEDLPLVFTHAYSAAEALAVLRDRRDFAVAIVDVVMEREDAGLQLVRQIREELGNVALRIILRTGQPGYAPEVETIRQYDINDYKTKAELTRVRLFTSVTMAIRSFALINQLNANRRGLEQVLSCMRELGKPEGLTRFAAGIVTQLRALLQVDEECLVCAATEKPDAPAMLLAAAGRLSSSVGQPLADIPEPHVRQRLSRTLSSRQSSFTDGACIFVPGERQQALAAYIDIRRPLDNTERGLLDVFCSNISVAFENLQLHGTINHLAFADELLGLPNRNSLAQALNAKLDEPYTLALVDLDSFSDINSLLDNSFGDEVLRAVSKRIRAAFSPTVHVSRVGPDVFGLFGPCAELHVGAVMDLFALPFEVPDSAPLRLSATSGWLGVDVEKPSAATLLKNVGAALKRSKQLHRGQALWYQPELASEARDRMQLLSELRAALSSSGLFLEYQPFVNLQTGAFVGAEALLRWRRDNGSFVPPDRFIALAEQSRLIIPLGNWVLRSAMRWRAAMADMVGPEFRVAVNISQVQFREPDFLERLIEYAAECGVQPHWVELELTESVVADNIALTAQKVHALRQQGFAIAIDDFGTGFSSLSVLQHLPVDRLKIDRSFVSGDSARSSGMAVAYTVLALAKQLGVKTIAEGIETLEQRDQLAAAGCEDGQGYLFSKPVDPVAFQALLLA